MHVGAYITCARAHGKNVRWCNRGEPARGVRLPLSTPLRYQPRLDIINGNAIFSSAVQFRVPLSRIRSSVLYADLSIPPRLPLPLVCVSFSFSFPSFDPRHSFISSLPHFSPHLLFCILFARAVPIQRMNIHCVFPARFS